MSSEIKTKMSKLLSFATTKTEKKENGINTRFVHVLQILGTIGMRLDVSCSDSY